MSIAFKEWALVCEALRRGDQSLILRKGGIAEGRDGFRFKHEAFFLFPTLFHEQLVRTKLPEDTVIPAPPPGQVRIDTFVRIEWTRLITDLAALEALNTFHILQPAVVKERFHYDEMPGINAALARVYRLEKPWEFPMRPSYGGCRSWVTIPEPPSDLVFAPALGDLEHAERRRRLLEILEG